MQEVFVFCLFFMSHSISINARQEVQPLRASQCWQVSLGKIGLALSVTQDSSYYSAGTAAATRRCEWVNERGFCFVHRQRCKKKKERKIQVQSIHLLHSIPFPIGLFCQANLLAGTSEYSEFFLVGVFFFSSNCVVAQWRRFTWADPPPNPPPPQRLRPGVAIQRSKACDSK